MRQANLDGEVVDGRGGGGGGGGHAELRESGVGRADQRRGGEEGGGAGHARRGWGGEARVAVREQRGDGGDDDGASQEAEAGDERSGARRHWGIGGRRFI